jgi:poly(beta-D-mannuronate) lyase
LYKITFLILIVCSFAVSLSAKEYLIDNVEDFDKLMDVAKAGDTIVWKSGTYKNVFVNFQPTANGEVGKMIVLKAEQPGAVIFKGNAQLFVSGSYLQAEGFLFKGASTLKEGQAAITFGSPNKSSIETIHCRVTNCAVINYSPDDENISQNYLLLKGRFNQADHCYFLGKTNKGPTVVIEYKREAGYVDGSDVAPSTHHLVDHNYFGFRTFPTNGGEQIRVGDSRTSFTRGFNIVEYNYFENERIEAEVISNKSWSNIYRFNSFFGNDGALVLRHGQQCFVYGNYINGKSGRNQSGGIRVINPNQTVFNNYIDNTEGGENAFKAPICIMSGLEGSELNEYYPADSAIVAYNHVVNSVGPAIRVGFLNSAKEKPGVAPKGVSLVGNVIIDALGTDLSPLITVDEKVTYHQVENNHYTNGTELTSLGFLPVKSVSIKKIDGLKLYNQTVVKSCIDAINSRLAVQNIHLSEDEMIRFNPDWLITKADVGVSWIK